MANSRNMTASEFGELTELCVAAAKEYLKGLSGVRRSDKKQIINALSDFLERAPSETLSVDFDLD